MRGIVILALTVAVAVGGFLLFPSRGAEPGTGAKEFSQVTVQGLEGDSKDPERVVPVGAIVGRSTITDVGGVGVQAHGEDARRTRFAVSAPGSEGGAADGESVDSQVRFLPAENWEGIDSAQGYSVLVGSVEDNDEVRTLEWSQRGVTFSAPPGSYVAAVHLGGTLFGPVVSFLVALEPIEVRLAPPTTLNLSANYVSSVDHDPVAGLVLTCTRTDLGLLGVESPKRSVITDSSGAVLLKDLAHGDWSFSSEAAGFADGGFEITLPGDWQSEIREDGSLDLGEIQVPRIRPMLVQLRGFEDWGSGAGFQVAHTAAGDQIRFDSTGLAEVPLGWYSEPLLLKLWYPDDQLGLLYLDAGLPPVGEPLLIEVGQGRVLEVDLKIAEAARSVIDFERSPLQVSYRTERGDSVMCGLDVTEGGVYSVAGIDGDRAVVSFATFIDDQLTVLAKESIKIRELGVSTCTLVVEGPPRVLRLFDMERAPFAGAYLEVREVPDRTTWVSGGLTDSEGRLKVPTTTSTSYSLRTLDQATGQMLLDHEVTLAAGGGETEVLLEWRDPSKFVVLCDGKPVEGVRVEMYGAHSSSPLWVSTTGPEGGTEAWRLSVGSTARIRLEAPEYWMERPTFPLEAGDHTIVLYWPATLEVDGVHFNSIRHIGTGSSLADWAARGVLSLDETGGIARIRVPSGHYVVDRGVGESESFELDPQAIFRVDRTGVGAR